LLINGWVRTGHPDDETSRLVAQIADAATRVTGIPADRVLVVIQNSPAHFAIEGGRVLPEPGEEQAWLAAKWRGRRARDRGPRTRRSGCSDLHRKGCPIAGPGRCRSRRMGSACLTRPLRT